MRLVSEELGYTEFTVRNTAILLGLKTLLMYNIKLPKTDAEFVQLLEEVRELVEKKLELVARNG